MKFPSGDLQQIFSEILKKKTKFSENSEIIFTGIIKKNPSEFSKKILREPSRKFLRNSKKLKGTPSGITQKITTGNPQEISSGKVIFEENP